MFRGGRVDSRGTGITTGLDIPGMQGGGMPPSGSTFNINMGGRTPIPTQSTIPTGGGIMDKIRNLPYLGRLIPAAGGKIAAASPFIAGGAGGIGLGMLADFYARGSSTPEGYARLKEMSGPGFNFDETNIDVGDVLSYIDEGNQMGEKYGFFPRGGKAKRLEELGLADKYDPKTGKRIELPEILDNITNNNNNNNQVRPGDGGAGNNETTTDIKDAIREDKELFAELLGAKKARGQDISDMLLSFSSKALAPEADVKSAFAEFAADEVKRPSRVRKVDDNAAALAINAYIAGEKSKADLDRILKSTEGKLKMETEILKNRSLISRITNDRSTGKTFSKIVSDNTKSWMEDNGYQGMPNKVKTSDIEASTGPGQGLLVPENEDAVFIDDTNKVYIVIKDGAGNLTLRNLY